MKRGKIYIITLNHFTTDWYAGILKPLLPLIMVQFGLTGGQVSRLPAILGIIASFIQPYGAILGMKFGEKRVQIVTILLTAIFTSLIGSTKNLYIFILFLALGRIANSLFHPNGATYIGKLSSSKKHTNMSIFSIGGTLGMAISSITIVWFVEHFGIEKMYLTSILGIAVAIFSIFYLDDLSDHKDKITQSPGLGIVESSKNYGVKRLLTVAILRTFIGMIFTTLVPIYLHQLNYKLLWGGYFLTFGILASALGNYTGAVISDKKGAKFINILSSFTATIFIFIFLISHNLYIMLAAFILLLFIASFPISANIAFMQELIPNRKGVASSLVMGVSWGITNIIFMAISPLIDILGIHTIMIIIALTLPIGGIIALGLPGEKDLN